MIPVIGFKKIVSNAENLLLPCTGSYSAKFVDGYIVPYKGIHFLPTEKYPHFIRA
jgi:hypothetical protein